MKVIPSLLYVYHNTLHSATGCTPRQLLFGWNPRDLRVPLFVADVKEFPVFEQWLQSRKEDLKKAGVSLEHARTVMIDAHKAAPNAHQYASGNLVKVSTRVVPMRCSSMQTAKLLPRYIGPFTVTEVVHPRAMRLQLPQSYSATHDVFSVADIRPWLSIAKRTLETEYPEVQGHSALNKTVQVLDRKRFG